jgi:KDO2-lipid IV(A) lauroyltransferase
MALYGFPIHSVARPLDNPWLDAYVLAMRELFGQRIVGKHGAIASMSRVIKSGGCFAVLVDQDARHHGIFVDFLGSPAATTSSVATLAHRHGVPILAGFIRRVGSGFRHEVRVAEPIFPDPSLGRDEDVRRLTQAYTDLIADVVRKNPDQWLWVHRRWKTRPEGDGAPVADGTLAEAAS